MVRRKTKKKKKKTTRRRKTTKKKSKKKKAPSKGWHKGTARGRKRDASIKAKRRRKKGEPYWKGDRAGSRI